jgi:hypothetical protein
MFGGIWSHRPYGEMPLECLWVDSELILCQDPINGVARAAADLEVPAWPTPEVDTMAAAGCKRVGAAARPPANFEAVGNATRAPANREVPAIAIFNKPAIAALPSNVFIALH